MHVVVQVVLGKGFEQDDCTNDMAGGQAGTSVVEGLGKIVTVKT